MSNRQSQALVKFEPVSVPPAPGKAMLVFGVVYPAAVIWIEAITHFCAQTFFDPMPTYGYVAAAACVPAGNLLVWKQLRHLRVRHAEWLAFVNGAAIAI